MRHFGMNEIRHGEQWKNNRGYVETRDGGDFDRLLGEAWLKETVERIRRGEERLKDGLPWYTPHYSQFEGNRRDQLHLNPHAFTHRSCFDEDDTRYAQQAIDRALKLNGDPESRWFGLVERIWDSARSRRDSGERKVNIDFRLPVGYTIGEAQEALAHDLGVPYDRSVASPERFIYLTPASDEVWRSPKFGEDIGFAERKLREAAYQRRGLGIDGRPAEPVAVVSGTPAPGASGAVAAAPGASAPPVSEAGDSLQMFREAMRIAGLDGSLGSEGERHDRLKRTLARSGICQVLEPAEVEQCVRQVAPEWWQADASDIRNLIRDFTEKYRDTPVRVGQTEADEAGDEGAQQVELRHNYQAEGEELWPKILPRAWKLALRLCPKKTWNALVPSMAAAYGAQMGHLKARDSLNWLQPPRLLVVIIAVSGGGKAAIRRVIDAICGPMYARADKARQDYDAWKLQRKLKGANKQMEAPPKGWVQEMPLDTSVARRLEMSKNTPKEGINWTFDEEGGYTLAAMEKQGAWNDCSKFLNAAWDGAVFQVERAGQESVSGSERASLNMCIFSQSQLARQAFGSHIAQGLTSRLAFCSVVNDRFQPLERMRDIGEADAKVLGDMAEALRAMPAQELKGLGRVAARLKKWEEERVREAALTGDEVLGDNGVRGRAMTNAFRVCQVIWACHLCEQRYKVVPVTLEEAAVFLADMFVDNFRVYFSDLYYRQLSGSNPMADAVEQQPRRGENLLDELPGDFTREDMKRMRPAAKSNALSMLLKRWLASGKVVKQGLGYRKTG